MIKYLHFILNNGTEHIFPLQSLLFVRSVPIPNGQFDIYIVYKESSDHGYQIIATLTAYAKEQFIAKLMHGIKLLQTTEQDMLSFIFETGEAHERNSTH